MKIKTRLLSGAGNTFHIVADDSAAGLPQKISQRKKLAQDICAKDLADGLIFLSKDTANRLSWMFYNNDGSDAEMCGNATRCVGYFAKNILKDPATQWKLNTVAGEISIKSITEEMFEVIMTPIQELQSDLGFFCNTGVPHLVLPVRNLQQKEEFKEAARSLRNHSSFKPGGTNVTYIQTTNLKSNLKAISYERGVEDYTQACGTGAMAAAFYNFKKFAVIESHIEMPGGTLIMNLSNLSKPVMTGPAVLIGSYEYEI